MRLAMAARIADIGTSSYSASGRGGTTNAGRAGTACGRPGAAGAGGWAPAPRGGRLRPRGRGPRRRLGRDRARRGPGLLHVRADDAAARAGSLDQAEIDP